MAATGSCVRRYVQRPPLSEHRIRPSAPREVRVVTQDLKVQKTVETRYSLEEFVERLGKHVPDRYRHNVRYFGLLAPRTKGFLYETLFRLLDNGAVQGQSAYHGLWR